MLYLITNMVTLFFFIKRNQNFFRKISHINNNKKCLDEAKIIFHIH